MKSRQVIICIFGAIIALGVFLYFDYWNSKPMKARRANDEYFVQETARYRSASPLHDATAAAAKGDTNFYGVMGVGLSLPGVTNKAILIPAMEKHQFRVIPGTSDVIEGESHLQYVLAANDYAKAYNLALLKILQTNVPPGQNSP